MMELTWGRVGYLASLIFPIFEHVHDIIDLPKPIRHASGHQNTTNRAGVSQER
jgi:hypothetical protein